MLNIGPVLVREASNGLQPNLLNRNYLWAIRAGTRNGKRVRASILGVFFNAQGPVHNDCADLFPQTECSRFLSDECRAH